MGPNFQGKNLKVNIKFSYKEKFRLEITIKPLYYEEFRFPLAAGGHPLTGGPRGGQVPIKMIY
jgi:hypothetical protein